MSRNRCSASASRGGCAMLVKAAILICVGVAALAVGLAARGATSDGDAAAADARSGAVALEANASPAAALIKVAFNRTLKKAILVDARGLSLYAFTFDDDGKPACYTDPGYKCVPAWPSCVDDPEYHCVKEWPPLTTVGRPRVAKGVSSKLLGVAKRRDGRLQITYNRHPLYFYAGGLGPPADTKPGDLNGQGFAGIWWAVSPKGLEIK